MRYSKDERRAHVELWRESGLSKAAYCRTAGIAYHCLVSWCASAGADDGTSGHGPSIQASEVMSDDSQGEAFVEIAPVAVQPGLTAAARIDYGNGRSLLIAASADPVWAGRLARAVASC